MFIPGVVRKHVAFDEEDTRAQPRSRDGTKKVPSFMQKKKKQESVSKAKIDQEQDEAQLQVQTQKESTTQFDAAASINQREEGFEIEMAQTTDLNE